MKVVNVWGVKSLPTEYILEFAGVSRNKGNRLVAISIDPFRVITEKDFKPYTGLHPRKLMGAPMPKNLYPFYGLEKVRETASDFLRMRLTPDEKIELKMRAQDCGETLSEYAHRKLFS